MRTHPFACAFVLLLAVPNAARATHDAENRQTDWSAFTPPARNIRIGLFKAEYGIFAPWSVGTYVLPWFLIPVVQGPILNLYTKVQFFRSEHFAFAAKSGFFYADVDDFSSSSVEDGDFKALIVPTTLAGSYVPHEDWTVSTEATWVQNWITGNVDSTGDANAFGVGAQKSLQFALTGEYRLTPVVAFNLVMRYAPIVLPVEVTSTVDPIDGTTAEIDAEITAADAAGAFMVQPGVTFSWKLWNVRAGVGYGNFFVPGPLLVSVQKTVVPDFDVYVRW